MALSIAEPTFTVAQRFLIRIQVLQEFLDGFMKFRENVGNVFTKEESLYNHICLLNRKAPVKWKALLAANPLLGVQPCKK